MYCRYCGKKLEKKWNGFFNEKTGEKEFEFIYCDTKDCQHGYHEYKSLKRWWQSEYKKICIRCGHCVNVITISSWE